MRDAWAMSLRMLLLIALAILAPGTLLLGQQRPDPQEPNVYNFNHWRLNVHGITCRAGSITQPGRWVRHMAVMRSIDSPPDGDQADAIQRLRMDIEEALWAVGAFGAQATPQTWARAQRAENRVSHQLRALKVTGDVFACAQNVHGAP